MSIFANSDIKIGNGEKGHIDPSLRLFIAKCNYRQPFILKDRGAVT